MRANVVLPEFGNHVLTVGRLFLDKRHIRIDPADFPTSSLSTRLQAGSAMEHNQDVLAQSLCLLRLANAQALSSRNHQHNRNDPPCDPEHSQQGTELMRPQSPKDISNQIADNHRYLDAGTEETVATCPV